MPVPRAGAPGCGRRLADGCPPDAFAEFVAQHPGAKVLSYINCSPEDISDFGNSKELPSLPGNSYSIPTIHIPEFDNLQSKMGDNSEISTEAIQALLFS